MSGCVLGERDPVGATTGTTVLDADLDVASGATAKESRQERQGVEAPSSRSLLPGPVPQELHVASGGLEWVWASPCNGGCSAPLPTYQDGYRFATLDELLTKAPTCEQFLRDDDGIRCAAEYFDPDFTHCDFDDCELGAVASEHFGIGIWGQRNGSAESWYVREDLDWDDDGVNDDQDNCPGDSNPGQEDTDDDGQGDVCDRDDDGDGVDDGADRCGQTAIPEVSVPSVELGVNRWALLDSDLEFETRDPSGNGSGRSYVLSDTQGCSCEQLIARCGYGLGHTRFGCSNGVMEAAADGDANLCNH